MSIHQIAACVDFFLAGATPAALKGQSRGKYAHLRPVRSLHNELISATVRDATHYPFKGRRQQLSADEEGGYKGGSLVASRGRTNARALLALAVAYAAGKRPHPRGRHYLGIKRTPWPGDEAVAVSVVHTQRTLAWTALIGPLL